MCIFARDAEGAIGTDEFAIRNIIAAYINGKYYKSKQLKVNSAAGKSYICRWHRTRRRRVTWRSLWFSKLIQWP
jgi:hypothetical protein